LQQIMMTDPSSFRDSMASPGKETRYYLIFCKRVVRITVQPTFAWLCGCDDRMAYRARVFACVTVRRAVAAERDTTCLAGPQMNPVCTDLYAFLAFAALRLFD